MEPRIVSRTHYQVDEPAFAEVVVVRCTSPVASAYDDRVADRLARDIQARGKKFNTAAARYAVDLAHKLHIVTSNNVWTENGHLVNMVAEVEDRQWLEELQLTAVEKLLHFRLFLEADGAALLFLSKLFLSRGLLPTPEENWNKLAEHMFLTTFSDYLAVTNPIADRVSLRSRIDQLRARGYKGKSGAHKLFLHLQTLHRLGFIDRSVDSIERQYTISDIGEARLKRLVESIPDVLALERIVRERRYIEVAADVFELTCEQWMPNPGEALQWLIPYYRKATATGVAVCPLAPVIEATQTFLLNESSLLIRYGDFVDSLRQAQGLHLRDIRFHQDRRGNLAFLRISDELISHIATQTTSSTYHHR